jgi:hypothetical protein
LPLVNSVSTALLTHKGKIMSRHHMTAEGPVPFTAAEEAARDAEEAAYVPRTELPTPTKEELMAQLNVLAAQIQALS